jgi:hypothetical protein
VPVRHSVEPHVSGLSQAGEPQASLTGFNLHGRRWHASTHSTDRGSMGYGSSRKVEASGWGVWLDTAITSMFDGARQWKMADLARALPGPGSAKAKLNRISRWMAGGEISVPDIVNLATALKREPREVFAVVAGLIQTIQTDAGGARTAKPMESPAATVADVQRLARLTAKRRGVGAKQPKRQGGGGTS